MTQIVTIEEAAKDISRLLDRVAHQSDEIVIEENGQPVARLIPADSPPTDLSPRIPGSDAGRVVMSADFDDPLPEEVLRAFEGE
jgi:prevent-host-death family protein